MKNKGFTLMELLGVIVILGVLALVVFPPIVKQINNAKEGISSATKALIIDASKDYYEDNKANYKKIDGVSYCIDVSTLIEKNYLNEKLKDKDLNDIDESKQVKLDYINGNFKYEVVDSCNYYTVTLDPDGGNISETSIQVLENSLYGDLPIPTKSGYTFMGWNGKNLWNGVIHSKVNCDLIDNKFYFDASHIENNYATGLNVQLYYIDNQLKSTGYVANIGLIQEKILFSQEITSLQIHMNTNKNDGRLYLFNEDNLLAVDVPYVLSYNMENMDLSNARITISSIQLEEGEVATEYEPYYITNDVKVTRNYDHTLKAIWKANN